MKKFIVVSEKKWHVDVIKQLNTELPFTEWTLINKADDFSAEKLIKINPEKIFIPHWSYLIPPDVYEQFECIVFHMTDLPYGRGGSPLQNLIVRGHDTTKISAIKVEKGIDTGPIYLKKNLKLVGSAKEIFLNAVPVIKEMIIEIIKLNITPKAQQGEIVAFKRRKPSESNVKNIATLQDLYNHIRMLDCEGYPKAFLETKEFRLEFQNVSKIEENILISDVRIFKK